MKAKKHLSFSSLRKALSEQFYNIEEHRQETKTRYSIHDTMMSGFACMFFQDPSLLQFQRRLKAVQKRDNLRSIFGVKEIPKDSQMREVIDEVESEALHPVFKEYLFRLQRGKQLRQYEIFPGLYLCSIDGTQYFSSKSVHCPNCLTTNKKGEITYSHKVLQGAIMHPKMKQVIPLMAEEISNKDGTEKQDCELKAAKRLITKIKKDHPRLGLIINGDDLFSREPFITEVLAKGMQYIFVAKPKSHQFMKEWIEAYDELPSMSLRDKKGRIHLYEWVNDIPLKGDENSIRVNFFRYKILSSDGKVNYSNSWITDLEITQNNIVTLVKAARCRWKIENECFNTLKNQGYHIEHNYGHGSKNLCFNFYLLTLLAFYFHQILELTDRLYQACREKFGSKRHLWENLRVYIRIIVFNSFEHLLDFALDPEKYNLASLSP
ncbi:MAG: hypothetical protein D6828_04585 [Nitrospirae bacterium]|nr:MAG: hypothetical protein D6828_04585 [Nitrospirota bacterium]